MDALIAQNFLKNVASDLPRGQKGISDECKIEPSQLSRIIRGKTPLDPEKLDVISRAIPAKEGVTFIRLWLTQIIPEWAREFIRVTECSTGTTTKEDRGKFKGPDEELDVAMESLKKKAGKDEAVREWILHSAAMLK